MNFQDNTNDNISEEEQEEVISEIEDLDEETRKIAFSKSSNFSLEDLSGNKKEKKSRKNNKNKNDIIDVELEQKNNPNTFNPRPLPSDWNGEISVEEYNKKHKKIEKPILNDKNNFPTLISSQNINKPLVNKLWGKLNVSK